MVWLDEDSLTRGEILMQVARRSAPQDTSAHESFLIFNFAQSTAMLHCVRA